MKHRIFPLALLLLAACGGDTRAEESAPADSAAPAQQPPADSAAAQVTAWRQNPPAGARVTPGEITTIETGPHTILWPRDAAELAPPYVVRASLRKSAGRLHEGYGLMFGGTGVEGPEAGQRYGYFLIRGDGSFLIKSRDGESTPVVRDWTRHPDISRDTDGSGRYNDLEVRVGADTVRFLVNATEVAAVPAAQLPVRGHAGLRISHDVLVEVQGFAVTTGTEGL